MQFSHIAIYAVHESDGSLVGFSFDSAPGTAEQDRTHKPVDRDDPGGELYLMAYATAAEAEAYTHALELCCGSDDTGWLVRTFAPNLTCVLVDLTHSPCSAFTCEDMRCNNQSSHDDESAVSDTIPETEYSYEYEPYTGQGGAEIPAFRIYQDGDPVAETNESLPADLQERTAILFCASRNLLTEAEKLAFAFDGGTDCTALLDLLKPDTPFRTAIAKARGQA